MTAPFDEAAAAVIVANHAEAGVLAALDALEAAFGRLPNARVPALARLFALTPFQMRGLMLLRDDLPDALGPTVTIRVCRGGNCRARGGEAIGERLSVRLGVPWYGTSPDGRVALEPVYCQGMCDDGPTAAVAGIPFPRLDRIGLDDLLARLGLGAPAVG